MSIPVCFIWESSPGQKPHNSKGRDTRCDKSLRHVAATGCCNKSPRVTCENHCRCHRILSLRSVARIQTSLNLCHRSQRQNKRKQPCRSVSADKTTCRRDVWQRFVASCVSALKNTADSGFYFNHACTKYTLFLSVEELFIGNASYVDVGDHMEYLQGTERLIICVARQELKEFKIGLISLVQ